MILVLGILSCNIHAILWRNSDDVKILERLLNSNFALLPDPREKNGGSYSHVP